MFFEIIQSPLSVGALSRSSVWPTSPSPKTTKACNKGASVEIFTCPRAESTCDRTLSSRPLAAVTLKRSWPEELSVPKANTPCASVATFEASRALRNRSMSPWETSAFATRKFLIRCSCAFLSTSVPRADARAVTETTIVPLSSQTEPTSSLERPDRMSRTNSRASVGSSSPCNSPDPVSEPISESWQWARDRSMGALRPS